ncbi:MAG: hypothetical protein L6R19_04910 [Alphaproteobacteria bacterium]|nr:hypothetical protein [Alphaproteobacteria bacterium]
MVVGTSLDLSGLTFGPDWDDTPSPGDQDSVVVNGSTGDDTVIGSSVADTVFGSDGFDTLSGGLGNDTLDGGNDGDTLNGNDGDDVLEGGDGADVLNGGAGFDTASYGGATGPVEINLALGTSTDGDSFNSIENITGATNFASTIFGSGGGNVLTGGDFDDELTGAQGDDTINGGDGDDTALGNMGDDVLNGGLGNDLLKGGAGADTYVIDSLSGADVISHFDKFDVVDLSALGSFFDVTDVQAASTDVRGGVLIDLGGGNSLTILGKSIATLDNGDFIF